MSGNTLIDVVQNNEKSRIVSVRYRNKRGTLAVHTMILCCYGGVVDRALATVRGMTGADLAARCPAGVDMATMCEGRDAVIASLEGSKARHANGETFKGKYTAPLIVDGERVDGMSTHIDDPDRVFVQGVRIGYRVIEAGEPKPVRNSRPLTIAKNAIRRGLSVDNWQALRGAEVVDFAANGERFTAEGAQPSEDARND